MENFDLTGWTMFSNRHNSENYISPDGKWMLKLGVSDSDVSRELLEREQAKSAKVAALGIPVPKIDRLVQVGNRCGLIYEYIPDKASISKCVGTHPEQMETCMKLFAEKCKLLHATQCDTTAFPSASQVYRSYFSTTTIFDDIAKEKVQTILDNTPNVATCLHGDLQTGNMIVNGNGAYFIDLGSFSYGSPLFDLGNFYHFAFYAPEAYLKKAHYMDRSTMAKCWSIFAKYYFGAETPEALESVNQKVKPYALVPILYFEHCLRAAGREASMKPVLEQVLNDLE